MFFRAKYHKLKYGTELSQGDMKSPTFDKEDKGWFFYCACITNNQIKS